MESWLGGLRSYPVQLPSLSAPMQEDNTSQKQRSIARDPLWSLQHKKPIVQGGKKPRADEVSMLRTFSKRRDHSPPSRGWLTLVQNLVLTKLSQFGTCSHSFSYHILDPGESE